MIHRLRPAESSDFDWLLDLRRTSAKRNVERVFGHWDEAAQRARFTQAFARQAIEVVEIDSQPVGAVSVAWDSDPVILDAVELVPQWQGRGLGTRLVHDVLLRLLQSEQALELTILRGNPAQALYERMGIHPTVQTDTHVTMRWDASIRTQATLDAAMSPWADPKRRHAWAQRLFDTSPEAELGLAQFVVGRHGLPECPRAVDVAPGLGRRVRPLARQGWAMTALSAEPTLHGALVRLGAMAAVPVDVRQGDVSSLSEHDQFDLALAFDGGLWTELEHGARVEAARRVRQALRPGGVLIVEGPNTPWVLHSQRELPTRTEVYHRAAVSWLPAEQHDFHDGVHERRDTYVVDVGGEEVAEWTSRRRLAAMDLPRLRLTLAEAGWGELEVFHHPDATTVGRATGPRLVVVARASS
ncbi:MAG: GNAT family N-acetyltransferase [Deltaproteobacteria bacterium]|nr:GNAT family N-acetyltransferase [Deltaproteobacteria bacterium]